MCIRKRVDPILIGEEIVYTIFHHIFHDESARRHFEFSQINFFYCNAGLPGWNIWFEGKSGAYQLLLVGADIIKSEKDFPGTIDVNTISKGLNVEGRFLIRYFPDINDPLLDHFSCAEALVRLGSLFDQTGTPSLSGQDIIEDNYFVVGHLDFRTTTNRNFVELDCIAPNRWKDIRIDGLFLNVTGNDHYQAVEPGAIDRDVPGWDLAFYLFDKLIAAFGYVYQTIPSAAVLAQKKWVRFEIEDTTCREKNDPDVDLFQLTIGFEINSCSNGQTCKQLECPQAYRDKLKDKLIAKGYVVLQAAIDGKESTTSLLKKKWWSARHLEISSNIESGMQHCCYHDH